MSAASLLLTALKRDNAELNEHSEAYLIALAEMLAERLEDAPKKARSLAYNLPRNQRLRRDLLSGALTPAQVCAMEAAELASDELKSARVAMAERSKARLLSRNSALSSRTRSVRCPECGGREATFTHTGADARDWHGRKNEVWCVGSALETPQRPCAL